MRFSAPSNFNYLQKERSGNGALFFIRQSIQCAGTIRFRLNAWRIDADGSVAKTSPAEAAKFVCCH
jgi:hypothetical protein